MFCSYSFEVFPFLNVLIQNVWPRLLTLRMRYGMAVWCVIYAHSVPCTVSTQLKLEDRYKYDKSYKKLQRKMSVLFFVVFPTLLEVRVPHNL